MDSNICEIGFAQIFYKLFKSDKLKVKSDKNFTSFDEQEYSGNIYDDFFF